MTAPDTHAPSLALIDSHCHLDTRVWQDDAGVDAVVARAHDAGVGAMIAIGSGYGFDAAPRALAVARRHPRVLASVGLHPHDAKEFSEEGLASLIGLARDPRVVALGEMGLDFHYDLSDREIQRHAFRRQLGAARDLGLPVIIHDRDSGGEVMDTLDREGAWAGGVLFHCYTGDAALMEQITARGGYISIPGIVTFKNAGEMREVARRCPIDRLLIETDSPFLTPVPYRGRRNEPAYVPLVGAAVAAIRGMEAADLCRVAAENTLRFFRCADRLT